MEFRALPAPGVTKQLHLVRFLSSILLSLCATHMPFPSNMRPFPQHAMGTSIELWHLHNTQGVKLLMGQIQTLSYHFHGLLVQGISHCGVG